MKLLPLLQQAFPSATGYDNILTVVQANAEGHLVKVLYADDENDTEQNSDLYNKNHNNSLSKTLPDTVFIKTVDALQYAQTKSSWNDLRRTLMYCRTEIRFYQEFIMPSSEFQDKALLFGNVTPQIYYAKYDLDGLIDESEGATDSSPSPVNVDWMSKTTEGQSANGNELVKENDITQFKGGYLIMEGITQDDYFQDSPISIEQAKLTLEAVASLHASTWQNYDSLEKAQQRLSRGSYHLKTRNPKELQGISNAWDYFMSEFQQLDQNGIFETCGNDFGQRIQNLAEYVCEQTTPKPNDMYATICHGDYKAMNCFLPKDTHKNSRGVIMVDFASVGVGLGMQDVAMHIHHALRPNDLANGGEMLLVDHYLKVLNDILQKQNKNENKDNTYPREVALRHYKLAVVDYFRFFLGRFWKSATPESFEKKKHSQNTALINRDVDAAFAFLERVQKYVVEIEEEIQQQQQALVQTCTDNSSKQ